MYRGVLFTFSAVQKHEICEDVFSAQLYESSGVKIETSKEKTKKIIIGDSNLQPGIQFEYPIFLRKTVETPWSEPVWSLSFQCFGKNFRKRSPTKKPFSWYDLTYAFHPKWLYVARKIVSMELDFSLWNFITLSPDYVERQQLETEKYYVNTQVRLSKTCCKYLFNCSGNSYLCMA